MYNQVIPHFNFKSEKSERFLTKNFINKECENSSSTNCKDIKQYFRCPHYCCGDTLSQLNYCINCECDRRRIIKDINIEKMKECLKDEFLMKKSQELTAALLDKKMNINTITAVVKEYQTKYLYIKENDPNLAKKYTPELWWKTRK